MIRQITSRSVATNITVCAVIIMLALAALPAYANEVLEPAYLDDIDRITVDPESLMEEEARLAAENTVWVSRAAGIPWSIVVEDMPNDEVIGSPVDLDEYAHDLLADYDLETSEGDENGMLLAFFVDQEEPSNSVVTYALDENFFPREGLTPARLDDIRTDIIEPLLAEGGIDEAVQQGAAWIAYTQMFMQSPRVERSEQQSALAFMLQVPGTIVAGLTSAGLVAAAFYVRRRDRNWHPTSGTQPVTTVWQAGAATCGRVDERVISAAIVSLVRDGSLIEEVGARGSVSLRPERPPSAADPFLTALWQHLVETARLNGGTIPAGATRELLRTTIGARNALEQDLIARGIFSGQHRMHRQWLTYASVGGGFLGLLLIVPSIAGLSRVGLAVAVLLLLVSVGVLIWAHRRPIATRQGLVSAHQWAQADRSAAEQDSYALIVWQDRFVTENTDDARAPHATIPTSTASLIRALRGLGPA